MTSSEPAPTVIFTPLLIYSLRTSGGTARHIPPACRDAALPLALLQTVDIGLPCVDTPSVPSSKIGWAARAYTLDSLRGLPWVAALNW